MVLKTVVRLSQQLSRVPSSAVLCLLSDLIVIANLTIVLYICTVSVCILVLVLDMAILLILVNYSSVTLKQFQGSNPFVVIRTIW